MTTALNLPGPVACARLRDLGAAVTKVEPPGGDPFEGYCPGWYRRLHDGMQVRRIDLKDDAGRAAMHALLDEADLLVTAQRAAALDRMGLGRAALARHPRLCHVAITGHAAPHEDAAGHDLTYMAAQGLLQPPALPPTLFADMAGAERAVSTALALVIARNRDGRGRGESAPLEAAAHALAQPLHEGLTRSGALLGGALPGYNLYEARDGWIAIRCDRAEIRMRVRHVEHDAHLLAARNGRVVAHGRLPLDVEVGRRLARGELGLDRPVEHAVDVPPQPGQLVRREQSRHDDVTVRVECGTVCVAHSPT